jgi:hypothetical protein
MLGSMKASKQFVEQQAVGRAEIDQPFVLADYLFLVHELVEHLRVPGADRQRQLVDKGVGNGRILNRDLCRAARDGNRGQQGQGSGESNHALSGSVTAGEVRGRGLYKSPMRLCKFQKK